MQRRRNTGAMPILPMITLLREFLIVSFVLCIPQVQFSIPDKALPFACAIREILIALKEWSRDEI